MSSWLAPQRVLAHINAAVAFLTLLAMLVGAPIVIAWHQHQSLRRLEGEVREARNQIELVATKLSIATNFATGRMRSQGSGGRYQVLPPPT